MTTRRSFMAGILAAATPPGFVRAGVLMPVAPLIVTREEAFDDFMARVRDMDVRVVLPPAADLEAQAATMFATFMAARMDAAFHLALTGQLQRGRA